ncbi:MAG: hypothetical protein HYX92_17770 [Chloroflexi bacterium]|nr:hypothetical protein [Chloroflexota bacterium]
MAAAKAGIPAVVIASTTFVRTASLVASWLGMPDIGIAEYPSSMKLHAEAEIRENVGKVVLDRIIAGLTKPAGSPSVATGVGKPEKIVLKGTFDEVNSFFFERGWTDGLAIAPPTVEKVEEYLRYTDRSPDEGIAILAQANLRATPRNIAVNAIMAGCRAEFMPLLIAAVEAIEDPEFSLINLGSTGCKTPWLLVNGPIVKQLGIEYGIGLRSRGPNPAIGRALGLILNNIAGFRAGETLMGTWGYYLPFVLAEDEDACDAIGWEPYHVEHGFSRGASTVTARATVYWGGQGTPGDPLGPSAESLPESILKVACRHQQRNTLTELSLHQGRRNQVAVLITPPTAKVLANAGYSKRDVAEYLWQNTRANVAEENWLMAAHYGRYHTIHDMVEDGTLPKWFDVGPQETIPMFASAHLLDVVVCGDAYRDKIMSLWSNYFKPATREIRLPVGWSELLKEAKR